ncbi:MAG TPA: BrnA antitoxin family protein [Syntrophorhabdus sp.]|jgi:predicted DNA binding CopG/RHH family protein|nr:BrnA antitoxin family protein [Syntrophorhabdaceae bacterium]MBP8698211.1 BrnA antitoxin family protein [Syntrophorhabdaceae bacterium]HQM27587.1 BrnA antitoxin family protein [Syntrophorhabdus sp.]
MKSMEDKENFELKDQYNFSQGIRGRFYKPKKVSTNIRLDNDIVIYYKKLATEKKVAYQTLMNEALRKSISLPS